MPEEVVQNPGQGGAGEAAEPTAPAAPTTPETPAKPDPLDEISDPVAREEAKKHRAIARRHEKKGDEPETPATPAPQYARQEDVALVVTNQAKALVSEEIREAWDELMKIPLGGANPLDAESIAANMQQRFVLYKGSQTTPNPAVDLSRNAGAQPGTPGKSPAPAKPTFKPMDIDSVADQLYGGKS